MMTENIYLRLCRLLGAWANKTAAEEAPPDFDALYEAADRHFLSAAACAALEQTSLLDACPPETARRFREAKAVAVRRTILMDAERRALLAFLEEKGIWYAPLKGVVVNAVYPQYGTRQFADNDILIDAERMDEAREHMRRRGYEVKRHEAHAHDNFRKPPIYNFELHRMLFEDDGRAGFQHGCAVYYADVRARLVRDEGSRFGYHFSDEDFYVYFLAHARKHYSECGTGLRTLLDGYLYRRARPDMDRAYVAGELEKLGLTAFESVSRALEEKLFGPGPIPALTAEEREMLDWVASSGVYGTTVHRVQSGLRSLQGDGGAVTARTKARFLFRRVFPPWSWYRLHAPFVYRHRWIAPFFWVFRLGRGVFTKGRMSLREAGMILSHRGR